MASCYICIKAFARAEGDYRIVCPACTARWAKPVVLKVEAPPVTLAPYTDNGGEWHEGVGYRWRHSCTRTLGSIACGGTCPAHNCNTEHGCLCP